jgi:predicted HD superfamily hydrolase involved in NAD metabolism
MTGTEPLRAAEDYARRNLSDKRLAHTLRVTETADRLAERHGLDGRRARLAALLHDSARELKDEKLLRLAREFGHRIVEVEREKPNLLHGPVAAGLARRELGVADEEVLDAIRVHTTAAPGMRPLALALYVADKIEPGRDYPGVEDLRTLAEEDLESATLGALRRAIAHNRERGRETHPLSLEALAWLEKPAR